MPSKHGRVASQKSKSSTKRIAFSMRGNANNVPISVTGSGTMRPGAVELDVACSPTPLTVDVAMLVLAPAQWLAVLGNGAEDELTARSFVHVLDENGREVAERSGDAGHRRRAAPSSTPT